MNYRSIQGGSAFPLHPEVRPDMDPKRCGMTLRDWFAGLAMQALLTRIQMSGAERARDAYIVADAMLEAREA